MYLSEGGIASSNWGCTVHKGFNSDCVESSRKENFSEACAVHKGEFRNFFNIGVAKVHTLKQSATVACMRSNGYKMLCESECGDSRGAKAARCCSLVLACSVDPRGDGSSLKVNSARLNTLGRGIAQNLASLLNILATPSDAYTHCKEQHSAKALYPKFSTTRSQDTV